MGIMQKTRGTGVLIIVLALVNGIAIWGQAGWASEHVAPQMFPDDFLGMGTKALAYTRLASSLVLAAALELTGVFLSIKADEADQKNLPSGGLRLGSYACGLLSGALNFSHWTGTAAKLSLGFLSAISPFLWGVHARVRRGEVAAPSRRLWHPIRSVRLIREMAWDGIASEEEAISRQISGKRPWSISLAPGARSVSPYLPVEHSAVAPIVAEIVLPFETEMVELTELSAGEIRPISPRPVSPAPPRAPRVSGDVEKAVLLLAEGREKAYILRETQLSPATYGRISKVFRILRADRNAAIDYRAEKVREEHVQYMRHVLAS
jgi:hypothetical protein